MTVPPAITSFLDKKFLKSVRVPFGSLLSQIKHGTMMPEGTLVLMASGDRKLRLRILEKDTPHKGFSEPLLLNDYARGNGVTANYLLWVLSHEPLQQYLMSNATGSVLLRVPRRILHSLPIPLPGRVTKIKPMGEIVITKAGDPFSGLLAALYRDYRLNFDKQRFRTAVVLAGAICEVILYQLLLEQGVSHRMLQNDRNLALGKMLDYIRLLKLDQGRDFPMNHLNDIRQRRNDAIHAGRLIKKQSEFSREDLVCFDHIVRYFGI